MISQNNIAGAKAKLSELATKYPSSRTMRAAKKLSKELEVFGKKAPQKIAVEKWFQGSAGDINLSRGTTLLIFWEVWCPHCKREVPKLQERYNAFKREGLQVVGLTKLSRSTTEERLLSFLTEKGVTFPIAKELNGEMSSYFNVSGVPAVAVVKDGTIVWRGHPNGLTDGMLKGWTRPH